MPGLTFLAVKKDQKAADMIRDEILAEIKRRGLNGYRLWKLVENAGVSRATVYAFLSGNTTLNTEHASVLLDALSLSIVPAKPKK